MLIDYIAIEKLPWIIVWMDWNFYAYKYSLAVFVVIFMIDWSIRAADHIIFIHKVSSLSLSLFIAFCAWNVYCVIRYGYAVG